MLLIGSKGTVSYLETWKAIELANQILGYNGWSSSIVEITQDYVSVTKLTMGIDHVLVGSNTKW
jgi:recombination DNA repair RAD52 pathway protein